jgi:hypothetical protein
VIVPPALALIADSMIAVATAATSWFRLNSNAISIPPLIKDIVTESK